MFRGYLIVLICLSVLYLFFGSIVQIYAGGSEIEYPQGKSTEIVKNDYNTDQIQVNRDNFVKERNQTEKDKNNKSMAKDILSWVIGGFVGALIALLFDKFRKPKLRIIAEESANQDYRYPSNVVVPGRWKFFRLRIENEELPKWLNWFTNRETAQQVNALITFKQINTTMRGRWAGTLELPSASPFDIARLANFPEPETIFPGESKLLDVFAKYENDDEAYGWNNEAYLNKWRTPQYKLDIGVYDIEIKLIGLNAQTKKIVKAKITKTIDNSKIF